MGYGSVAQWIEQFRPKEKVVRSTRTRVTNFELELVLFIFVGSLVDKTRFTFSKLKIP